MVLRFFDYDNPTIEEHAKIIDEHSKVWWGWWKKDAEPTRDTELETLSKALTTAGRIKVGLTNLDKATFYEATVIQLRFEKGKVIPSPDRLLTPTYYADKECAAWFCISEIMEIARTKFDRMFGVAPSRAETFFLNLPKQESRYLKPHKVSGDTIIHLSDIHFGADHAYQTPRDSPFDRPTLLDIIVEDIHRLKLEVGALVVSGDLTTKADSAPFMTTALDFLNQLVEKLEITKKQVIIVPGNHDLPLDDADPRTYSHEAIFQKFLNDFYGESNHQIRHAQHFIFSNNANVQFLAMNSVRLRSIALREYGYVGWRFYENLIKSLQDKRDVLRIAILHHHLVPAPTVEFPNYPLSPPVPISLTLDAGEVIQGLQQSNFRIALHGHQHVPAITKVARGYVDGSSGKIQGLDRSLYVVACGSTGSKRLSEQMRNNAYTIIHPSKKWTTIRIREFSHGAKPTDHLTHKFRT